MLGQVVKQYLKNQFSDEEVEQRSRSVAIELGYNIDELVVVNSETNQYEFDPAVIEFIAGKVDESAGALIPSTDAVSLAGSNVEPGRKKGKKGIDIDTASIMAIVEQVATEQEKALTSKVVARFDRIGTNVAANVRQRMGQVPANFRSELEAIFSD